MLTATYTLVSLSVEQASVRVNLQSLQKVLQSNFIHLNALSPAQVEYACDALRHLYDSFHWRKIEQFLIPAVRRATREADLLVRELDVLSRVAADAMGAIAERMAGVAIDTHGRVLEFCGAVDVFSRALLERMEREERELFPVARAVISGEDWFAIANQMLAHDAYVQESRLRQPILLDHAGQRAPYEPPRREGKPAAAAH
jgi:hemerythrin-like domain-containing protein